MFGGADTKGPHLVETGADHADKDLEDEDENYLLVGLHLQLRELSPCLALVAHYPSVMAAVHHQPIDPFRVLQGSASQQQIVMVQ